MDLPPEPKPGNETKSTVESSDDFILNVLPPLIKKDAKPEFSRGNEEPESKMQLSPEMDLQPEPKPENETKIPKESSENFTMNVLSTFIEKDAKPEFSNGKEEPESEMDLEPEPKPRNETKNTEESSDNFAMNVLSAFFEKDTKPEFLNGNEQPESQYLENKHEEKSYSKAESSSLEHCNFQNPEKQNKMDINEQIESVDKNNTEAKYFVNGLEEKESLEMDNDFQQQINHQDDGSNTSSISSSDNSSGIEKDFELHEDYDMIVTVNEGELNDNTSEGSSANHFHDIDNPSNKKGAKVSENSGCVRKEQAILNLINNEDNNLKRGEGSVSGCSSAPSFDAIKFPYKDPSNAFEVVVPLIGKNVMSFGDIKPFNQRYDLAKEINRLKGLEDAPFMPKLSYQEWRKQRDARPQEEKDREVKKEKFIAIKTAVHIIKISIKILEEMQKDNLDEKIIERWFFRFLSLPASPLSLLLSSQFVHVMMYVRGSSEFSQSLRYVADRCYWKCHVMFPIPEGYNFQTVYTSEVVKNIPQQLNGMCNYVLDYGEFECPFSDSDDSAFSESDGNE